jgi:hypothetical protein
MVISAPPTGGQQSRVMDPSTQFICHKQMSEQWTDELRRL